MWYDYTVIHYVAALYFQLYRDCVTVSCVHYRTNGRAIVTIIVFRPSVCLYRMYCG